ncbi:Aspartyl/glutamyl-tRNA(Asn/Gln) amidotransferase subunit B [Anatilimnocola aggregata]|uniref:Aspartyl/glutamyl-tRNA(Asn/Gln) amidotransferase subunit B n=1 Tax=Anatilimnocola aggregata TaxID=2528021 RepID=A0A517YC35_9BACT|nr:Asp-tRNA(Asn)/Glu-tRNA(Gln) amidotransferase subunit GatB [Anatilimnocola aggregata]QDU27807.1 Aspartyl/glutamyl-tRNA(Asn/Gln) amidotransferase subunit B [Anatilimnocola aggregata]
MSDYPYDIIIGLETHVQLQTKTKLFCRCSTKFGAEPNTQTCPVCIGMPGSLPVMNREAFELSLQTAIALNCEIPEFTKWDRKNYYYPDLPKGYQISQFDLPMSQKGWLEIFDTKGEFEPKRIGIIRAHLEEDAGKSLHDEAHGKSDTRIDLNRTGTPLLEIVSEPDMRSTKEARAYLTELKLLLTYLGVSDCNMQEGSLRVDANVNIHIHTPNGKIATPIVEIKNLNSFRFIERALAYEVQRQYKVWQETGRTIKDYPKQTRGWDDAKGITLPQREKEDSADYRYFPDPDLAPVITPSAKTEKIRASLCELPAAIRKRLEGSYGVTAYDSDVVVIQGQPFVDYFEEVAKLAGDGKKAANWVTQDVLRVMNEQGGDILSFGIRPPALAELVKLVISGDIEVTRAKEVFNDMVEHNRLAPESMKALGIAKVDLSELEAICKELVLANPKIVADVKGGKVQAVGSLLGQAKKRNPNANPNDVRRICLELIEKM